METKPFLKKYGLLIVGVLLGAAYGIVTRIVFGQRATMASITYLFVIPVILGIVPLLFAKDSQLRSYRNIIFIPWVTIIAFFVTALAVGLEEVICLLVLASPLFVLATIGAFIVRLIMINRQDKKKLLSVMILPFLLSPAEEAIKSPSEIYNVQTSVIVNAQPREIWENVVRVKEIERSEFTPGIFYYLGIPRPLRADADDIVVGGSRVGHFDGGLRFVETFQSVEQDKRAVFTIEVDPNSISDRVFDQHVLNGNYFKFIDAAYDIEPLSKTSAKVTLSSRYRLTSKVNFYGNFWGELILDDFQGRLLEVVKTRSEASQAE